jgi:hypothetical protein
LPAAAPRVGRPRRRRHPDERGPAVVGFVERAPKRNGKVERYQQALKREWGLGQRYRSSAHRAQALPHWFDHYNHTRTPQLDRRPSPDHRVRDVLRQDN